MPQIGDELYQLPPSAFTAARDAAVAQARAEGDAATAAAVAAMRRPTVAAWLVNLVALRHPESVHRLVALGDAIRSAQSGAGSGQTATRLRDLAATRRSELAALLRSVERLAAAAGGPAPSKQQLADVEATVSAAMADPEAARIVQAGRVLKALAYHGFGTVTGAPAVAAVVGALAVAGAPAAAASDREARRAEAQARHEASRRHLAEARQVLSHTQAVEADATQRLGALVEQRAEVQRQLGQAGDEARAATRERLAAERAVAAAERAVAVAGRTSAAHDVVTRDVLTRDV